MRILAAALAGMLVACSGDEPSSTATPAQGATSSAPTLELAWRTDGFFAPEGVAPAPGGGYFISNVGGEETNGDGYVSIISTEGAVVSARFIDGLDGPKGMAVLDGALYVSDVTRVRVFDAATGAAGAVIEIPDGRFLNDVTVWGDAVYVSDSATSKIWRLDGETPTLWREGEELSGVNGLTGAGDKLYVSTMSSGSLYEATSSGGWRLIAAGMEDADGVGIVPQSAGGGFLVSSWPGDIHYVSPAGAVSKILDTRAENIFQNDLTTFGDIAIVPNWEPGSVTAWRIVGAQ